MRRAAAFVLILLCAGGAGRLANAGAWSSGGGSAVVCRAPDQSILSAEVLDIFEARSVYGQNLITHESMAIDDILKVVQERLQTIGEDPEGVASVIPKIHANMTVLPEGVKLEPIHDAKPVALPKGCKLEQLAAYIDPTRKVAVDREVWEKLDNLNKAALIVHEGIYQLTRKEGDTDSRRARKLTGYLFSEFSFESLTEGIPQNAQWCVAKDYLGRDLYVFAPFPDPKHPEYTWLQFIKFAGQSVFSKTTAVVPARLGHVPSRDGIFTGGRVESKIEGTRSIMLGFEQRTSAGSASSAFYILDEDKRYITCPSGPN